MSQRKAKKTPQPQNIKKSQGPTGHKVLKTVNIDIDSMIKESDQEQLITDGLNQSITLSENIPAEMGTETEYINITMSIPSA